MYKIKSNISSIKFESLFDGMYVSIVSPWPVEVTTDH